MARPKKHKETAAPTLTPDDIIVLLAMHHASTLAITKTVQAGFAALVTAMGARPDLSTYPDPTAIFMEAFDEMTGEPDEPPPPELADDAGGTTGS